MFKKSNTNTLHYYVKKSNNKTKQTPKHKWGALVHTPRKKQVSCKNGGKNKLDSQPSNFAIIGHLTLTLLLRFGTLKFFASKLSQNLNYFQYERYKLKYPPKPSILLWNNFTTTIIMQELKQVKNKCSWCNDISIQLGRFNWNHGKWWTI